jgi:two-component system sensor histidine kinase DesK
MKIKQLFSQDQLERMVALVTWFFVAASALYYAVMKYTVFHWRTSSALVLFLVFAFGLVAATKPQESRKSKLGVVLAVMYLATATSFFVLPYIYLAILLVIWSALLPYVFGFLRCLLFSLPLAIPLGVAHHMYWQQNYALLTAALFWTFNLFAMIMSNTAIKERQARERADLLNRQLLAAQQLIRQAGKQDERLRIARNIHDVLGHHLTALSINLQVASHKCDGIGQQEAKAQVDQCYALAKLLLSDVREAVTDMREQSPFNFQEAVEALFEGIARPRLHLFLQPDLRIENVKLADVLLRAIQEGLTNVMRHTRSEDFIVELKAQEGNYILLMQDIQARVKNMWHASNKNTITPGNGLTGMRERVSSVAGSMEYGFNDKGFYIHIQVSDSV